MTRLALAALLLAACPSTALHSTVVPGLWLQRQHDLNTQQPCLDAPELLRCAEKMAPILLRRAAELGYSGDWGRPALCLIERQEPCCIGSVCAESSSAAASRQPRAGCTYENASWIARRSADGEPYDYSGTLEDELRHSIADRLGISTAARHTSEWDSQPATGVRCDWRR